MGKLAKHTSGEQIPDNYVGNKTLLKMRDFGHNRAEKTYSYRKKINKRNAKEAAVNARRPTSGLTGYFSPQNETYCKSYSQEELDALNASRGNSVKTDKDVTKTKISELFSEEELKKMTRDCYKKDIWIDRKLKEYPLSEMSYDHIINIILVMRRTKYSLCYGLDKKWLRKFAVEIEKRDAES